MPQNLARKYGKNPAQILLRRNVQQGDHSHSQVQETGAPGREYAVLDFAPEGENMAALGGMDQNCRTSHDPLIFDF